MAYRIDVCCAANTDAFQNFVDHVRKTFQDSDKYRNKGLMDALNDELSAVGAKNIMATVYIEFEAEEDATMFKLMWL